MPSCALCRKDKRLRDSHITPAFATRWIKETSATGFIRNSIEPDRRVQDSRKLELLCDECEQVFSNDEREFANKVFYPYTQKELSAKGVATATVKEIPYDRWLLRFILSVQWRVLITSDPQKWGDKFHSTLMEAQEGWRRFLLSESSTSGAGDTHIIFLQNLAAAQGMFPARMADQVNRYLLRSIDATPALSRKAAAVYSKLGPIAFFTSFRPDPLPNSHSTRVRMRGVLTTAQRLRNTDLTEFVFITRPNEALTRIKMSDKQKEKVAETYRKNLDRAAKSMTVHVARSDYELRQRRLPKKED